MATFLVNVGKQHLLEFLAGETADTPEWVAWGTGAGTTAASDTTLFTEASEDREQGVGSTEGSGAATAYKVVATLVADGSKTITNAGVFTDETTGRLFIKGDFAGIALDENDAIEFTFTLSLADPA